MSLDIFMTTSDNPDMKKNNTTVPLPDSFAAAPNLVATMLAAKLGESEVTWTIRLANWRRPGRASSIPWHETEAGKPVYDFADVQAYIDHTLTTRAATTPPAPGENLTKVAAVADVANQTPFVRVLWNAGTAQGALNISPTVARELATKLLRAAGQADQLGSGRVS